MPCKCYHADKNFLGKIGVCWGTKDCEACSCGGNESKCDFYEDKRKKATPETTNADRIRAMTDEELALFLNKCSSDASIILQTGYSKPSKTVFAWLDWLRQEAST